jgi:hypothetical protein
MTKKEINISMHRPPWKGIAAIKGCITCTCNSILTDAHTTRKHWQSGHFDFPVYGKSEIRQQAILDCIEAFKRDLPDCSGCTDPRSEGTHQGDSKQHFQESWADHTGIAEFKKREGLSG